MKPFNSVSLLSDRKSRLCLCILFITASLILGVYFVGGAWLRKDSFRLSAVFGQNTAEQHTCCDTCKVSSGIEFIDAKKKTVHENCNGQCRPLGSESLPKGIVTSTSNLEMRPLWGPVSDNAVNLNQNESKHAKNLLAIAVGINQKTLVNQIVSKFLGNDFAVMLFHYDGVVDKWRDLEWNERVIHISATNQTKWWFAKRFLHPDIVAEYEYIFLWDEDLDAENFHPQRYLSIIKEEGLEISQPALDPRKSEVHHHITVRRRKSRVHRRYYKFKGGKKCDDNSTAPPCVGWVEMMAPVFSRAAWRCIWHMIQNDLIHAWGLDVKLGYCAQGDRTVKVGVVDEEYIIHIGLPTLGGHLYENKTSIDFSVQSKHAKNLSDAESSVHGMYNFDNRPQVRWQSYTEMMIFKDRWEEAVEDDKCWADPYAPPSDQKIK